VIFLGKKTFAQRNDFRCRGIDRPNSEWLRIVWRWREPGEVCDRAPRGQVALDSSARRLVPSEVTSPWIDSAVGSVAHASTTAESVVSAAIVAATDFENARRLTGWSCTGHRTLLGYHLPSTDLGVGGAGEQIR
jgi:hypothetical protein